jgi:hypothetical protein
MGATGSNFDLSRFEAAIQVDPDVLGVLYTGSLGRGTADRYSDLDIECWVAAQAYAAAATVVPRLMGHLGTVHFAYDRQEDHAFMTGLVGPDWQRVDLELHRQTDIVTAAHATGRVVKDLDGSLTRMLADAVTEPVTASWSQTRAVVTEAIDSQIYLGLHNARGAVWSAMGEISYQCAELYTLLALLRGRQSFGFRYVEQLLSPDEQIMLADAWPREPKRDEVRRAADAFWTWTRHVWRESEVSLGQSLEIRIDESGLLAAVDRLYSLPADTTTVVEDGT